jgi:hypothetical protein
MIPEPDGTIDALLPTVIVAEMFVPDWRLLNVNALAAGMSDAVSVRNEDAPGPFMIGPASTVFCPTVCPKKSGVG